MHYFIYLLYSFPLVLIISCNYTIVSCFSFLSPQLDWRFHKDVCLTYSQYWLVSLEHCSSWISTCWTNRCWMNWTLISKPKDEGCYYCSTLCFVLSKIVFKFVISLLRYLKLITKCFSHSVPSIAFICFILGEKCSFLESDRHYQN